MMTTEPNCDYWTMKAMLAYGGGFVKCLGQAAMQADPINIEKIKSAWPEYWREYEDIGIKLKNADAVKRAKT